MPITGRVIFDYSNNNGVREIGRGCARFETMWTRAGTDSIHAYHDPSSIDAIAIADGVKNIKEIKDAARFDYSSRWRQPQRRQILILKNQDGYYAALKILSVKSAGYNSDVDEVRFDYVILSDGGRDFSMIENLQVTDETFSKRVLLVGAGFAKNWGGMLASEVHKSLFSHPSVQERPATRKLLLEETSFEVALEEVRRGKYEHQDQAAIEEAIISAFEQMDGRYRNPNSPVPGASINDFIARFCPGPVGRGTGYVFSLNQDLLLERIYGTQVDRQPFRLPGVTWPERRPDGSAGALPIPPATISDLVDIEAPHLTNSFNLIKLHGSINWLSSPDSPPMVMGTRKTLMIGNVPLLAWYHQVFEEVLSDGDVRLLVIGYGWADEHINEAIAAAVKNHGLRVFSWNPTKPADLLNGRPFGDAIEKGLMGYATQNLTEVMPPAPQNPGSPEYDRIVAAFF